MKRAFQTASCAMLAAALLFYVWQNGFAAAGGQISLPKALWLGAVPYCSGWCCRRCFFVPNTYQAV
ncbi:hypothetical protein [Kingella potus]|uniref:hypothetical protein n=1 Tax=Kingella potus TaxID=265175 RepID=UPI001FD5A818|nr:hypothetical protein [Kingella potus]UOP01636.1 hypothetical protein LVJ84_05630 [Kingella potus]